MPRQLLADLSLLFITLIWGGTFVMVKDAVAAYPVFPFLALRFVFAALALAPLALGRLLNRRSLRRQGLPAPQRTDAAPRDLPAQALQMTVRLLPAALIGAALYAGYSLQTLGLQLTTPSKAGFITGLSVVLVPLAAAVLLRQSPGRGAWLGVGLATTGLALLSLQVDLRVAPGDLLVFGCALAFAAHILLTGRFATHRDPLLLTFGQVATVAVLCVVTTVASRTPLPPLPPGTLFAAAFTGLLATSLAFGVQTFAQRATTTTHTALIIAAEPVFAALFSFLLIGELLGPRQLLGCGLILVGMIVAETVRDG